jgi:hypothetical protein
MEKNDIEKSILTRNIGELPVSRSSFPLLLEDSDEITVWILWLDLLFSTVCAKGRLDQIERGSVTTGGAVGRKQLCVAMLVVLKLRYNRVEPQLWGVAPRFSVFVCHTT